MSPIIVQKLIRLGGMAMWLRDKPKARTRLGNIGRISDRGVNRTRSNPEGKGAIWARHRGPSVAETPQSPARKAPPARKVLPAKSRAIGQVGNGQGRKTSAHIPLFFSVQVQMRLYGGDHLVMDHPAICTDRVRANGVVVFRLEDRRAIFGAQR